MLMRPRLAAATRATATTTATAAALALAVSGCTSITGGIYSLPLPGGANLGNHPYQVTARFADVLDLVPQSAVKVNDVSVGRVTSIYLPRGSWTASVSMLINGSVKLPANAIAQVEQSSLLGEQFIALSAPPGIPGTGALVNGAVIPEYRTTTNTTVEEVLGALSLLLNGGGINQLHTITAQLAVALNQDEPQVRQLLTRLNTLLANLNSHRGDIMTALDGLNQLSATLAARDRQIGNVLDNLTPGLRVLADERDQLVTLLNSLHSLSTVAVDTINASQQDLVNDLQLLAPTLNQLANAGQSLPLALQVLLTYPFTDQVLSDVKGDYLNIYLHVQAVKGTSVIPPVEPPKAKGKR
jgi:phospholipid/cholesterol/gamma-HCH transport system substrate-binding protein